MILHFSNGDQIRGDAIIRAALRSDLAPIPVTLEADLRADESVLAQVKEGMTITTGHGDRLRIVYSQPLANGLAQGDRLQASVRLVAFLDECAEASFVRERAVIKENHTLLALYRVCGCTLRSVAADFSVARFVCMVGDTPTFHIARALQEAGGVVRWKAGSLHFFTLADLFKQKAAISLPNNASDDIQSGFLERHEAPFFFSVAPDGSIIQGNRPKARTASFSPHQTTLGLNNLGRVLVRRKTIKTDYAGQLCAGDLVDFAGSDPQVIITACHYYESGTDRGGSQQSYSKLWTGGLM